MAITISANISKKVNFPGSEYGNIFASITINAEVSDLAQIPSEAKRLYAIAETAVDEQLRLRPSAQAGEQHSQVRTAAPHLRQKPPASQNQIQYLSRLLRETGTEINAILTDFQIPDLRSLSGQEASGLIAQLAAVKKSAA